jgi:hypothetical protein
MLKSLQILNICLGHIITVKTEALILAVKIVSWPINFLVIANLNIVTC